MLQRPLMNDSSLKTNLWAALKSERIATMLCHVRRIARDQLRMRQCLCKATDKETQFIQELGRSVAAGDVSEDESRREEEEEEVEEEEETELDDTDLQRRHSP